MAHYIDKSAVIAEIERLEKKNNESENVYDFGTEHALKSILSFIDTLEVEEVDLENELKEDWLFADKTEVDCLESMCLTKDMFVSLAKKYFAFGLKAQKNEPVSDDLQEEITRYFSKNPIKPLTDWPVLKNTALHFANWQKEQKSIWHTMDEPPKYPCDILFRTNVDNMFLYRYMENGRPVDKETPYFNNILNGKCWCYCSDIINN